MFCKKCGTELSEGARFCPKCGYDTQGESQGAKNEVKEDKDVVYQVKPIFKLGYKILTNLGRALLYIFLFGFIILGDMDDEITAEGASKIMGTVISIIAAVVVIYMVIKLIFEKIQYNHYEYNFYNTKVEYVDGFLNREEKELKYKNIREVALKQNIVQRLFNIGTIRIFTNASSRFNSYGNNNMRNLNGLNIHCVENPKEQYEKLKELIDKEIAE